MREFSQSIYRFGVAGRIHIESFRNQPPYLKKWLSSNKTSAPNRPRLSIICASPCTASPVREDHDGVRSEPVSRNPYRLAISPTIRGCHRGLGIPLDQAKGLHRADVRVGAGPRARGLGVRREHLEFDLGLRILGARGASLHLVRGGDHGVPRK